MNHDVWNVFHDGDIVSVVGSAPGEVCIEIEIQYLRELFTDPGTSIFLTLHKCTRYEYELFKNPEVAGDMEILSVKTVGDVGQVCCQTGILYVCAEDFSMKLDSGRTISFEELCWVSAWYWADWSGREL
jgi:hypothetical protein